ncbi:MAG: nitric oxide dioxygenase, partial [Sphingomonas sp.]
TPMVAMLETLTREHPEVEAHFVHGTHHGGTHAMDAHVTSLVRALPNASVTRFYETPRVEDAAGTHYDHAGRIGEEWLLAETPVAEADYYLCGPRPFLRTYVAALAQAGVPASRIHYEFFGPADELLAA